jgi:uncharacterized membrane protein (UPF0136 family)
MTRAYDGLNPLDREAALWSDLMAGVATGELSAMEATLMARQSAQALKMHIYAHARELGRDWS